MSRKCGRSPTTPVGGGQTVVATGGQVVRLDPIAYSAMSTILPLNITPDPFDVTNSDVSTAEVVGLFETILGRAPDPAGEAFYLAALRGGVTLDQAAGFMLQSPEYETRLITSDYATYLDHVATPTEISAWLGAIQQGGLTAEKVAEDFLASDVFSAIHPDNSSYVTALDGDVLGEVATASDLAAWQGALGSGVSRARVVVGFVTSPESYSRSIAGFDPVFLEGSGALDSRAASMLQRGMTLASVVAEYIDSTEFIALANSTVR